jgi:plastocyanin
MKSNRITSRKRLVAIGLTAATLVSVMAVTAPAPAAIINARIVAGPGGFLPNVGYLTPVAVMGKGGSAAFTNLDVALHNVVSPRFSTPLIGFGQSKQVKGVKSLPKGNYPFKCTLHPWMKGTLVVV